jgi:hypothetical protein
MACLRWKIASNKLCSREFCMSTETCLRSILFRSISEDGYDCFYRETYPYSNTQQCGNFIAPAFEKSVSAIDVIVERYITHWSRIASFRTFYPAISYTSRLERLNVMCIKQLCKDDEIDYRIMRRHIHDYLVSHGWVKHHRSLYIIADNRYISCNIPFQSSVKIGKRCPTLSTLQSRFKRL